MAVAVESYVISFPEGKIEFAEKGRYYAAYHYKLIDGELLYVGVVPQQKIILEEGDPN